VFPNLAALVKSGKPRADLEAILLTGNSPFGVFPYLGVPFDGYHHPDPTPAS
jgi:hypothetical protein